MAHLPLALTVVGLMAACAAAPDESSGAPAISTAPIASATAAATETSSGSPDPSERASLVPSDEVDASGAAEDGATVEIVGFAFAPLTISAGSEVTFTNLDSFSHTATAGSGDVPMPTLFDSGRLPQGDSFTFAFADPGTYVYYCAVHPAMEASITVEE